MSTFPRTLVCGVLGDPFPRGSGIRSKIIGKSRIVGKHAGAPQAFRAAGVTPSADGVDLCGRRVLPDRPCVVVPGIYRSAGAKKPDEPFFCP